MRRCWQQTSLRRLKGACRPVKADGLQGETMNTCPKRVGDYKVGPADWLGQNFELKTDHGLVNHQIHQPAVNMPHRATKVTRTTSITELLLIGQLLMPSNAINHPRPTHQPKRHRSTGPKGNGEGKESEQQKATVAFVNIAKHRPRTTSDRLLQLEISVNSPSRAEVILEKIRRSQMPMKGIVALQGKLPSGLERARFRDKIPTSQRDPGSKNGRSPHAPLCEQICAEWNEEQEEFAPQ